MKQGWTEVALGEVLTPRTDRCAIHEDTEYREVTVAVRGKGVRLRRKVLGAGITAPFRNVARAGDFIISKIDARHGAFGFIPSDLDGAVVTNDFPLFAVRSEKLMPRWLYWITQSPFFTELCKAASAGSTNRVRLDEGKFRDLPIPLPPLAEQHRIAARLDAIESRLTRVRQLREEQTQKLQSALRTTFHRLVESTEWKPLSEVAPLAWRQIAIEPETSYTEFGVRSFYKGVFLRRKVPGSFFDWQELYRLKAGDIVFSNIMAWEKAIAVAGPEHDHWVGNHRMLICEPREDVMLASCLLHYFMTEDGFAKILKASPGTAARNKTLKADRLMEIEVPVPPLAAQREFQKLLTLQTQVAARAAESESATTALLPSLLDQIFAA